MLAFISPEQPGSSQGVSPEEAPYLNQYTQARDVQSPCLLSPWQHHKRNQEEVSSKGISLARRGGGGGGGV